MWNKKWILSHALTPVSRCVAKMEGVGGGYICHLGISFFHDVSLVELMYLVSTHMPDDNNHG